MVSDLPKVTQGASGSAGPGTGVFLLGLAEVWNGVISVRESASKRVNELMKGC